MGSLLQTLLDSSSYVVFFGGAGVSTESGIPDFRSADGIYSQRGRYSPEEIVSASFFREHTEEFFEFYLKRLIYPSAKPNTTHLKLAELERAGKLKAVITQNVDGLHQAAGAENVLELHGSVHRNYCTRCHRLYDVDYMLAQAGSIPRCECGGVIKPDVVLYEENLDNETMRQAIDHVMNSDLLIVGGTSLTVFPAAGMVQYRGGKLVLINKTQTSYDYMADLVLHKGLGEVFGELHA